MPDCPVACLVRFSIIQGAGRTEARLDCAARTQPASAMRPFTLQRLVWLNGIPTADSLLRTRDWDCGRIVSVRWDEPSMIWSVKTEDIHLSDGSLEQMQTDAAMLRNAALAAGWQDADQSVPEADCSS